MKKPSIGLSLEGLPFIGLTALLVLVFALLEWAIPALLAFVLLFWVVNFFRDPERVIPQEQGVAVSPADGKVVKIETMRDPLTGEDRTAICVFMNVFNVHVNRAPVSGTVEAIRYYPGKFFNASLDKASSDNERNAVRIKDKDGNGWTVVQIAGLIARRIICWTEPGDNLARGDRFGLIKFGSRLDLYLPGGYVPCVRIGDTVLAGQTILASKEHE
ncbi:phosphatidylserine decarboxylase family protein [Desulfoplanes formicivorans]|uniref:Phosphatidylserine decarboxylase proenzyme n=1 Tax=Desulfoplanes formicivorans TaxID=1592317 RepID=A0A194AJ72_9BACT|nr:phosphatidylserine decarboxylase family protein [Desulfoplanes formicivorans]GAU09116.1 phosphatidylserine decarboxylase [Desulfoplanes formicivorans]